MDLLSHRDIPLGGTHRTSNWEYANEAARLAATGFTSGDVGKEAWQLSDDTFWVLKNHSPVTWASKGGSGGGAPSGPAGGVLSGTYPNPGFASDMATQAELDAHEAASDPHPGYLTTAEGNAAYDASGAATAAVAAHVALPDPHTQYAEATELTTHATNFSNPHATTAAQVGALPNTLADAKGDLPVASAADTWSRLGVGANGKVLTANSVAANGIEWADPPTTATGAHDHTTAGGDGGVLTNDEHDGFSEYAEIASPTTPAAGKVRIYPKADGKMYRKDDTGTEAELGGGGGGTVDILAVRVFS